MKHHILGASRRTVELYLNKIFKDNKTSIKAHKVSKEVYGLAGKIFINKLIDDFSSNEYKEIKEKYEQIQDTLQNRLEKTIVSSYVQSISVVILADILMNNTFDFGFNEESSIELGLKILNQLEIEKEIDEVERAKEIIENWLIINNSKFLRHEVGYSYNNFSNENEVVELIDDKSSTEVWGMYQEGIYYVFPLKFNELMRKNNFSPNKIRKRFC